MKLLPFESEGDYFDVLASIIEVMEKHDFHDEEFCRGPADLLQEVIAICKLAQDASEMAEMFRNVHGRWYFDGHEYSEQHGLVKLNEKGVGRMGIPE